MSSGNATADERRAKLRELIRSQGFVSIPDLRLELEVSESTIRRDLDSLVAEGEVQRTHGGVFYTGGGASLQLFEDRRAGDWDGKRHVARAAAQLIENHDTLLLDGGSTTYELARHLVGRPLQIVTNSLPVANLFAASDQADLVLLGGYVHSRTAVSLGPYANQMLATLNVQKAFLSIAGVDARGYYNSNLLLVETERAMMSCADQTIVVADSSKFGKSSLARLCALNQVHTVVTDQRLSDSWRERVTHAGVELIMSSDDVESCGESETSLSHQTVSASTAAEPLQN